MNRGFYGGIEFKSDGAGRDFGWDDDGDYEEPFLWGLVGEQTINLQPLPDAMDQQCEQLWRDVKFDFEVRPTGYGYRKIVLVEIAGDTDDQGVRCFRGPWAYWLSDEDAQRLNIWNETTK